MERIENMEQAIITLEETVRNVDSKLDSLTWKFEEFEKGVMNVVKDKPKKAMVSVMELMQDIESVRKEYSQLTDEIQTIQETEKEITYSVNTEINNVHRNFFMLRQSTKQFK